VQSNTHPRHHCGNDIYAEVDRGQGRERGPIGQTCGFLGAIEKAAQTVAVRIAICKRSILVVEAGSTSPFAMVVALGRSCRQSHQHLKQEFKPSRQPSKRHHDIPSGTTTNITSRKFFHLHSAGLCQCLRDATVLFPIECDVRSTQYLEFFVCSQASVWSYRERRNLLRALVDGRFARSARRQ